MIEVYVLRYSAKRFAVSHCLPGRLSPGPPDRSHGCAFQTPLTAEGCWHCRSTLAGAALPAEAFSIGDILLRGGGHPNSRSEAGGRRGTTTLARDFRLLPTAAGVGLHWRGRYEASIRRPGALDRVSGDYRSPEPGTRPRGSPACGVPAQRGLRCDLGPLFDGARLTADIPDPPGGRRHFMLGGAWSFAADRRGGGAGGMSCATVDTDG